MEPFTTLPGLSDSETSTVPYPSLPATTDDAHRGQQPARAHTWILAQHSRLRMTRSLPRPAWRLIQAAPDKFEAEKCGRL